MSYLLDTNIIIIYSRENDYSKEIEKRYQLFKGEKDLYVSVVTLGELDALIKKNNLGLRKQNKIKRILRATNIVGIEYEEIIALYGDIDAFSQGKKKIKGHHFSSINMGKNDIWIAATASHYDLKLLTTDKDFQHLKEVFIDLEFIPLESLKRKI